MRIEPIKTNMNCLDLLVNDELRIGAAIVLSWNKILLILLNEKQCVRAPQSTQLSFFSSLAEPNERKNDWFDSMKIKFYI